MTDDITSRLRKDPESRTLWKQWYQELFPRLIYQDFPYAYGKSYSAQDAAHDAFIGFLDSDAIEKVRNNEEAVQYLLRLLRNSVSNERRREARRRALLQAYEADVPHGQAVSKNPAVSSWERLEVASKALKKLDEPDRIILLATLRGDTLHEISDQIGMSYSAVGVRRHRIMKKLLDGLPEETSKK